MASKASMATEHKHRHWQRPTTTTPGPAGTTGTTSPTTTTSITTSSITNSAIATVSKLIPRKYSSSTSSRPRDRKYSPSPNIAIDSSSLRERSPHHSLGEDVATPNSARSASSLNTRRRGLTTTVPLSPRAHVETDVRPRTSSSAVSQTLSPSSPLLSPRDLSPAASYFALRSNPSGNELRSPLSAKRPPASRSSHGIETTRGPPPALSTQRSLSVEGWRLIAAEAATSPAQQSDLNPRALARLDATSRYPDSGIDAVIKGAHNLLSDCEFDEIHDPDIVPSKGAHNFLSEDDCEEIHDPDTVPSNTITMTTISATHPSLMGDGASVHGNHRTSRHTREDSQSSNEDLFYDLANGDDDTTETAPERRSSRIGLPAHRHVRSQPNANPTISQVGNDSLVQSSPITRDRRGSLQRPEMNGRTPTSIDRSSSLLRDRQYATSAHPLEQRRKSNLSNGTRPILTATRGISTRERSPETPSYAARRQSITDSPSYRYRNHLTYGANGAYHSSPLTGRHDNYLAEPSPPIAREGTESSVSTTAPSTVWDELDDLKSRIRNLELTGKLPGSNGAVVSGATERPRTATTTVTTMSSSPKRAKAQSISPTNLEFDETVHPLLQSALAKSRSIINTEIYRALEATSADALNLAKMTSKTTTTNGVMPTAIDRQLKRKADSLCRSLTELCIALSEAQPPAEATIVKAPADARPMSRDRSQSNRPRSILIDESRFQRSASLDPEPSSARVLSRLESRRQSMMSGTTAQPSPQLPAQPPVEQAPSSQSTSTEREPATPTQSTLTRTNTVLQRIRNADDNDTTIRPLSRAMTELGRGGRTPTAAAAAAAKRRSREYTSNHPLPSGANVESWSTREHVGSQLPRRSYFSSSIDRNGTSASQSPRDVPQTQNGASQPGTPGTPTIAIGRAESTVGRLGRRNYLERKELGGTTNEGPSPATEARQKRLSSLGLGSLVGRR